MKKYIEYLVVVPVVLLVLVSYGFYYRFDPSVSYNLNNVETAADSVCFRYWYEGVYIDSHMVLTAVTNTTGLYQVDTTVAEAGDYLVKATVYDASASVWMSYAFTFTAIDTIPDTVGLMHEADTTGLAESAYAEFIDGTNENQFKADVSALALEASLLTEDDNIGIDWGDIINQDAASVLLTGTSINTVALVTAIDAGGIEEADYASDYWVRMAQTVWDADSATYMDDNDGSMAYGIQQILDSIVGQGTDWSAVGAGSDSVTSMRWMKLAAWAISDADGDSLTASERVTSGGGGCSGTGSYSCTLWVRDTANAAYVQGAKITVNNQTEDGTALPQITNANGYRVFQLDAGDYRASVSSPPGIFDAVDFTMPATTYNDSVLGYYPTIGTPSAASICSVYSWIQDAAGQKVVGAKITATLVSSVDTMIDGNMLVVDHDPLVTTSDADGYWSFGLIKSSVIDTSAHYQIAVYREQGQSEQAEVYVPDSNTVNYIDLLRSWRR